jgi:hypothetical protein
MALEKPIEPVDAKTLHRQNSHHTPKHRILHYTLRSENRAEFKADRRAHRMVESTRIRATQLLGGLGTRLRDSVILINPIYSIQTIEDVIREVRQLYKQLNSKLSELGHPPLLPPIIAVHSLESGTEGGEKIT